MNDFENVQANQNTDGTDLPETQTPLRYAPDTGSLQRLEKENELLRNENALLGKEIQMLQEKTEQLIKKLSDIMSAKAKLPEFSVSTESAPGKYQDIKNVFRKK
jgi:predicted RNase H-like nuclease (RuvC/YqgF family)